MNREIKFRVWHTDEKVMEYPEKPFKKDADYWDGIYGTVLEIFSSYLNQPERIFLQYTGQKTNDGRDIYDGDIVFGRESTGGGAEAIHFTVYAVVSWDEENGKWIVTEIGSNETWDLYDYSLLDGFVGNIYENPEMLLPKK